MNELWRLDELVRLAGQALDAAPYEGQSSGRVRDVPDARTIRYYTTLGILDRPLEMRGRTAYYGQRHLLQIVAVKRLQTRGMSLVDIQSSLAGADTNSLKRWAAVPAEFWTAALAQQAERAGPATPDELLASAPEQPDAADRARFWAAEPAMAELDSHAGTGAAAEAQPAVVLSLATGVSLIIAGRQSERLDATTLDALRPALQRLRSALERTGILRS